MMGLLNVNKPPGQTSRDAVNRVQRLVRPAKVGHAGTLDPLATGVLLIGVGSATRLIPYVQQLPKCYRATFLLGRQSDSDDLEGHVRELLDPPRPTNEQIAAALPNFLGTIQQRPPSFSAVKVDGRRAYTLARAGKTFELDARPVTIHNLSVGRYDYPELVLDIECGSGTYIRSLGRDLAESLGTAAVMSNLERTSIGDFTLESACELAELTAASLETWLLPARDAVQHLGCVELTSPEIQQIRQGMSIGRAAHGFTSELAGVDPTGQLVAILTPRGPDQLRPVCNLDTSG